MEPAVTVCISVYIFFWTLNKVPRNRLTVVWIKTHVEHEGNEVGDLLKVEVKYLQGAFWRGLSLK